MTRTILDAPPATFPLEGGLSASFAIGLGLVLAIEGAVLHLWIASRSHAWAWVITLINVATLYWIWREFRAGSRSALRIGADDVEIVVGDRLRCRVARSIIASAEAATWRSVPDLAPDYLNTAKPLEPNITITFREPVAATMPFGIRRRFQRVGLRVREPDAALALLARVPN